jgi:hypothetical protein
MNRRHPESQLLTFKMADFAYVSGLPAFTNPLLIEYEGSYFVYGRSVFPISPFCPTEKTGGDGFFHRIWYRRPAHRQFVGTKGELLL